MSRRRRRPSTFVYDPADSYRWQGLRTRARAQPVTITFVEPTTPPGTRLKRLKRFRTARAKPRRQ